MTCRAAAAAPRRRVPALVVVAALVGLGAPAAALGALTATHVTVTGRAASERVVVAFAGGTLTGLARQVDTPDPGPANGRATVRVNATGITSTAAAVTRNGVHVRIVRRPGNIVVLLDGVPDRFKFVSYRVSGARDRLVIHLWRANTRRAATIIDDGCLRLTAWRGGSAPRVRGLELEPLFEHNVVTSLRADDAGAATIALRPRIATGFRFLPDFTGYSRPGRWGGPLPHTLSAPRRAMLEAWSTSAKDGSLECLVQVPVLLRP